MTRKNLFFILIGIILTLHDATAQVLKPRPDALPWQPDTTATKAIVMASTVKEMSTWDRYPTYNTYLAMMQQWLEKFPQHCSVDTIGTSVQGRLILSMHLEGDRDVDLYRPQFFYSSTIHGDEVTGYVMMLRLIDTLLNGYGTNPQYTNLLNTVDIHINPLSNPDGTYHQNDNTVTGATRYNANFVDLNRNYPDPFGTDPLDPQQVENTAMINYFASHNFRLSANLHGGAEVLNYPWDSFSSFQQPHPDRDWWIDVCKRFVDTSRSFNNSHFRDVTPSGYIEGGDWYVIPNGRQDYVNYTYGCLEMTMEISTTKTLSSSLLPEYWSFLQHSLVNYIEEIHSLPDNSTEDISHAEMPSLTVLPNPAHDRLLILDVTHDDIVILNMHGQRVMRHPAGTRLIDLGNLPNGIYLLRCGPTTTKVVKQ